MIRAPRHPPIRLNRTRYSDFWRTIDWSLPDLMLAEIWQVDRANLRARRVRLGAGRPRWRLVKHRQSAVFLAAVARERVKARRFTGPRPAGPARSQSRRGHAMPT